MPQCLRNRQICIVQLNIFAYQTNSDRMLCIVNVVNHLSPVCKVRCRSSKTQFSQNNIRKIMCFEHQRCLIQHRDRYVFNDTVRFHIAEQCNFLKDAFFYRFVCPHIRFDPQSLQILNRVLRRLALMLIRSVKIRYERHMYIEGVLLTDLKSHLSDGLKERLAFNISRCSSDLGYDNIRPGRTPDIVNKRFDFIRDVWNHLDGFPEIFPTAFFVQYIPVHLAGCQI